MFKLKRIQKNMIFSVLCILLVCSMQACAACTAVYVGQDVSEDGSIIFARSNDFQGVHGNHVTVTPRVENEPGRLMPVNFNQTVKTEIPATTYQYTATPSLNSTLENASIPIDAAACTNEYGVSMSMSVTAFSNKAALEADPLVDDGITEFTANDLVICQSKTAREGVEVLLGLIDKYGSSETNIAIIADQNEVWYVEMYTGHQYAAVKLPRDKVSVFGNEFSLDYISDYEDNITSKNLISLAEEKGFAVHGKNNEVNLFDTYSGKEVTTEYSHLRTWYGHQLLSPSKFSADYKHNAIYPLCFTPDKKVSVQDVCDILRNRYEGTKYSPDKYHQDDIRVIGSDTTMSAHVIQVFPNLPADMSTVTWVSSGPPVYGVYVPVSNDCINVSEAYGANQPLNETDVFDTDNYPYYTFKDICTRCVGPENYKIYGEPVQAYWHKAESNMFTGMGKVLTEAAKIEDNATRASYITSYCNDKQTKAFEDAKQLLNDLAWTQSQNSNTFKIKRNPETHQMTGEKVVIPPMEVKLDASKYNDVPEAPK